MTELTDDELLIIWRFNFAKTDRRRFLDIARAAIAADRDLTAALAKPADGPAAVAERPSDEELGLIYHDCCRGCEFMDQVGFEDAARAVLARWGQPPAPPAEGEVAELVAWLHGQDGGLGRRAIYARIAELLERHAAMENLAADAVSGLRYIEQSAGRLYGVGWDRVFDAAATLQPAHALPLPAPQGGEVQS